MSTRSLSRALCALPATALVVTACAASRPPSTPSTTSAELTAPASPPEAATEEPGCELVCGGAEVVSRPAAGPDYSERATANANQVIEAMHADLLACYAKRVAAYPNAHAFLTIDVVIGPDGLVRSVETTGGALLGDATMKCITQRIARGVFEPPHGGGTLRIQVPFTLRRVAPGEDM